MATLNFNTELQYLKGVGPDRAKLFAEAYGIKTLGQLLYLVPNRYEDRSARLQLNTHIAEGTQGLCVGELGPIEIVGIGKKKRLQAFLYVDNQKLKLLWFRGLQYATKSLKVGAQYTCYGKITGNPGFYSIVHPELKLYNPATEESGINPIYPSSEKALKKGLNSKAIQKIIENNIDDISEFSPIFNTQIEADFNIPNSKTIFYNLHYPKNISDAGKLIWCLKLEELFYHQLLQNQKRIVFNASNKGFVFPEVGEKFKTFYSEILPFELTSAQKRVLREIRKDSKSGQQMNRLLQGDVGSGKTMVAFLSALLAVDNSGQACIMAPTEILAQQHFKEFRSFGEKLNLTVEILTGSIKGVKRRELLENLADGKIDILVGTHALIEPKVVFKNLSLAIVDEQHRFGVAQRAKLSEKNNPAPHVLVMTATPIPRTLTMSHYGDLDLSVIDELPPGRKPVITAHRTDADRLTVFQFIKDEVAKGRQVYVVYPLIEESEALDYKDLMDGYNSITRAFPLPQYQTAIVHGKMDNATKAYEMQRFVDGIAHIMVATTVIEVGVNVPNASVMVIESSEKFGLSQLHQLRGRIGRGAEQSYCILMTKKTLGDDAKTRIETMVASSDGFKIAEVDLKLRGPGNVLGTQQSGVSSFRFANIAEDFDLLKKANLMANNVLSEDPNLQLSQNLNLNKKLTKALKSAEKWANIG